MLIMHPYFALTVQLYAFLIDSVLKSILTKKIPFDILLNFFPCLISFLNFFSFLNVLKELTGFTENRCKFGY